MRRTAVVLFAGDARREEAQKGLRPRFLGALHERLTRTIRSFDVDLLLPTDAPTLGEKIERAFSSAFASGYERVIILAGDIVLPPAILEQAIESKQTVIGPCVDGGFYLLACDAPPRVDWNAVAWFTSRAFDDVAAQLGDYEEAPELRDVDSIDDARLVAPSLITSAPRTSYEITIPKLVSLHDAQLRAPPQ
jgi:glycosyltransferase A (GT-A) superfamily protein (DUF2064 family)